MALKYKFNVFSGTFDLVNDADSYEVITHEMNSAGNPMMIFDPATNEYLPLGPLAVIDNAGNEVKASASQPSELEELYDAGSAGGEWEETVLDLGDASTEGTDIIDGGGA